MTNNQLKNFIEQTKQILCFKFFKDTNGLELKNYYPIIFDQINYKTNMDTNKEIELSDYLGQLYEKTIPQNLKKDLGQFYTRNTNIIDLMINKVDLLNGKILEPSCGSGLFLVKIQEYIIKTKKYNLKSEDILNYLTHNLYGNDINKFALELAELNLLAHVYPLIIDAVKNNKLYKMKRYKLSNFDFVEKNIFSNFSLVIGNPPFVTLYGKRSRNMTEIKRKYYNTFDFVQNKNGNNKFNLSMFFIENGLKALNKSGDLIFILDISFFETAYIDLRKYLLENYDVNFICTGLSEFEGVASGQIIIKISNNKINDKVEWYDKEENKIYFEDAKKWLKDIPKYRFRKSLKEIEENINTKIKKHKALDYFFPNKSLRTCCALTGKTENFVVNSYNDYPIVYPYLEGSKGLDKKFGKLTPSRLIKYDYDLQIKLSNDFKLELAKLGVKNKKRVTLGDKDAYDSPKVFIRQSSNELIASYTEEKYAANNSLYILTSKSNSLDDTNLLKFTCGILNSDLMTFYALINRIIRIDKGKAPQIKTSDLKDIRIPFCESCSSDFIKIVEELQTNPDNIDKINTLNNFVYDMFKINKLEIYYIKEYLQKLKKNSIV